jgi:hypothetical protein
MNVKSVHETSVGSLLWLCLGMCEEFNDFWEGEDERDPHINDSVNFNLRDSAGSPSSVFSFFIFLLQPITHFVLVCCQSSASMASH